MKKKGREETRVLAIESEIHYLGDIRPSRVENIDDLENTLQSDQRTRVLGTEIELGKGD